MIEIQMEREIKNCTISHRQVEFHIKYFNMHIVCLFRSFFHLNVDAILTDIRLHQVNNNNNMYKIFNIKIFLLWY